MLARPSKLIAEPFSGDKRKLTVFGENFEAAYDLIDPDKYDLLQVFSHVRNRQDESKINRLKTKSRPLYLRPSLYRAVNTFHLGYKNQSVYAVSGTSRCLFSDKYKTWL